MPEELTPERIRAVFMEEATRGAERAALATSGAIQRHMPAKTGTARRSMTPSRPKVSQHTIRVTIGSNIPYVRYLDQGTGLFGPHHERITPKARQALSFVATASKGQGRAFTLAGRARRSADVASVMQGMVAVASVAGIEAMHFVERGYNESREVRLRELQAIAPRVARRLGMRA